MTLPDISVRPARPDEYAAIGALTARVYLEAGFIPLNSPYLATLRDAAARAHGAELLVAVDGPNALAGSVTFAEYGGAYAELAGPDEAEFRMLVVAPEHRKHGAGRALVGACLQRARASGCTTVRLSTQADMTDAHRLYERHGFLRTPERDWSPLPGKTLLSYALML